MEEEKILPELLKLTKENTEVLHFMQDNMVMKEDLEDLATKEDLESFREEVKSDLSVNFSRMNDKLDKMDKKREELETKTQEDADAAATDLGKVDRRLSFVENKTGFKLVEA